MDAAVAALFIRAGWHFHIRRRTLKTAVKLFLGREHCFRFTTGSGKSLIKRLVTLQLATGRWRAAKVARRTNRKLSSCSDPGSLTGKDLICPLESDRYQIVNFCLPFTSGFYEVYELKVTVTYRLGNYRVINHPG